MRIQEQITALILAFAPVVVMCGEPVCEFENPEHRLISGNDPSDLACIRLRAAAGDESQEFYLGLVLIGQVPGPTNIQEGLTLLIKVAKRNNKYSPNAMLSIGEVYRRPNSPLQNYALAYQWFYLASQKPPFEGTNYPLPDAQLNLVISPKRMKELKRSAQSLLQDR